MTVDNEREEFWRRLVEVEHGIVVCAACRGYSPNDLGSPQTSWAGSQYKPGGLVVVLQNPGVSPSSWNLNSRDQRLAAATSRFRDAPTVEDFRALVSEMHSQMQGLGPSGTERWGQWVHPVSKCIAGCLTPEDVVWANVSKHRTPGGTVKDRPTTLAEQVHGLRHHLRAELDVLRPRVVIAVGAPALVAMQLLSGNWTLMKIKQRGATTEEAFKIRDRLRTLGLCAR